VVGKVTGFASPLGAVVQLLALRLGFCCKIQPKVGGVQEKLRVEG
jgi:hypothetical protein